MGRVISAFAQFFDGSGAPLQRGWLRFLESGSNNTDKNTFFDSTYQIPNANPLQLDGEGRCPNVFGTGDYRVISYVNDPDDEDSPGEMIQLFDPVTAEAAAPTGGGAGSFGLWDPLETYSLGDIITYNTVYYRSLIEGNLGKNPGIEEDSWERVDFLRWYNSTITYSQGDLVFYQYNLYLSKQALNVANTPQTSPAWWRPVATGYHNVYSKTGDYEILPTEYDSIFILADTVVAAHQFDLPAMDSTTDRFRVSIYNASDYDLTVNALGSTIWIDTSGDIILTKGAFAEFVWSNDLSQWLVFGSVGPTLGAQDIGTPTTPVENVYADFLFETLMPDDEKLYFGTDSDFFIEYDSVADVLNFNDFWQITAGGNFLPDATNPAPNIGSATAYVANAYVTTIYSSALTMPDTGLVTIGTGNALRLSSNDSLSFIYSDNVDFNFGTTTDNQLYFYTNGVQRVVIDGDGTMAVNQDFYSLSSILSSDGLYAGTGWHFQFLPSGVNGVINASTGNLYLQTASTTALLLDTSNAAFFYGAINALAGVAITGSATATGNITASGQVRYGTLNDGVTTLSASLLEINQRCDNIPSVNENYYNGVYSQGGAGTYQPFSLNLGTVNAGSFAIIDFGYLTLSASANALTVTGTASVDIGSSIATSLAAGARTCATLEINTSGTLVLVWNMTVALGGGSVQNPGIKVTWIKKT